MKERARDSLKRFSSYNFPTLMSFDVAKIELELLSTPVSYLLWTARGPDDINHSNIHRLPMPFRYTDLFGIISDHLTIERVPTEKILIFGKKSNMANDQKVLARSCQNLNFWRTMSEPQVQLLNRTVRAFKDHVKYHLQKDNVVVFWEELDEAVLPGFWEMCIDNAGQKWRVFQFNFREGFQNMI